MGRKSKFSEFPGGNFCGVEQMEVIVLCLALSIHVSPKTKKILENFDNFELEEREDEVFLKVSSRTSCALLNVCLLIE